MSLTTEQKINLLILAGFEPAAFAGDAVTYPRIVKNNPEGVPALWRNYGSAWKFDPTGYTDRKPMAWEDIQVAGIPDELIYKAIQS